jgi:hypothetical protein
MSRPRTSLRPETPAVALQWEDTKKRYPRAGLCHKCATQAADAAGYPGPPQRVRAGLLRGRYRTAVARMEATGVPIDSEMLEPVRTNWAQIKTDLIRAIDQDYGAFDGTTFKAGLLAGYLADNRIDWPRTAMGRLQLDRDAFGDMAKRYPQLEPLKELRHALGELRLEKLAVGPDDRNRALLSPFGGVLGPDQTTRGPGPGLHRPEVPGGLHRGAAVGGSSTAGCGAVRRPISGVRQDGPTRPAGCN